MSIPVKIKPIKIDHPQKLNLTKASYYTADKHDVDNDSVSKVSQNTDSVIISQDAIDAKE